MSKGLVIVVTGANGGVGFGICHRLLVNLSSANPPDAQPFFNVKEADPAYARSYHGILNEYDFSDPEAGVTIIMACRDPKRAQDARARLYALLDQHIAKISLGSKDHAYASTFRRNVRLELETLDLSSVRSVLDFGRRASDRYEYISHLIFNAGTATYSHLDILGFVLDLFRWPVHAVHHPRRNMQVNGVLSKDNLGYTWQCNTFGHYMLYRSVQDLLLAYTRHTSRSARVLWMSSLDAEPEFDPADDWQLTKTYHSYQASKFQIELIVSELEKRTIEAQETGRASSLGETVAPHGEIHHLIVSPGITSTNMSSLLNIWIPGWRYLMIASFWIVRLLGAPHVLMSLFSAAVSAIHLALVPLAAVPTVRSEPRISPLDVEYPYWHAYHKKCSDRVMALRFGSENDKWGRDRTGVIAVPVWEEHPNAGEVLLERFERLYQAYEVGYEDGEREGKESGYANGHAKAANGKAW
ncbi:hypothetical protein BD309DRAFT_974457 [Dichomitus squalens]|uniref:Uncharacterized protein n=1 Tax=Dichomitus squalens TaxID=114155 RepID=A0A4Q9NAH8_9APHY|nr:hypothetical protein BD309DRAFT_974457 [Dichomitus squalens]TBU56000.1 hypothetical protein BD310DRAFT_932376 [Dichomitus squalens]